MNEPAWKNLANILLFTAGWWISVLGAASGAPWIGPVVVAVILVIHFSIVGFHWHELLAIGATALLGFFIDSGLAAAGAYRFHGTAWQAYVAPVWLIFMWLNFGIILNHSLGWLGRNLPLAIVFSAIGGPAAYYGGAQLGAMSLGPSPLWSLSLMALVYGVFIPGLFRMAGVCRKLG